MKVVIDGLPRCHRCGARSDEAVMRLRDDRLRECLDRSRCDNRIALARERREAAALADRRRRLAAIDELFRAERARRAAARGELR